MKKTLIEKALVLLNCYASHTPEYRVIDGLIDRVAELEKNDKVFRQVVDKLASDNGGIIPGWLLDLAP